MTPPDLIPRLRALLARGCFFPDARALAQLMLSIAERRAAAKVIHDK